MKSKKLILLIAVVLMFSLAAPAFAASFQTKVTANISLPDLSIDVVVPGAAQTYLNPKNIPVKVGGVIESGSIISDMAYIENKSLVPVSVGASVVGTVKTGSDLTLSADTFDADTETLKKAFLYLDMEAMDDPSDTEWWQTFFGDVTYDAEKHVLVTTSTASKENIVTLAAYDAEKADADAKRYGAFRLTGVCSADPDNDWNSKDGVSVDISFTFKALPGSTKVG